MTSSAQSGSQSEDQVKQHLCWIVKDMRYPLSPSPALPQDLGIEYYYCLATSLVTQVVENLPAMRETWVQSLDQEDLLEKGMATHSSILAWEIPWTEEPQATVHGIAELGTTELTDKSSAVPVEFFSNI